MAGGLNDHPAPMESCCLRQCGASSALMSMCQGTFFAGHLAIKILQGHTFRTCSVQSCHPQCVLLHVLLGIFFLCPSLMHAVLLQQMMKPCRTRMMAILMQSSIGP